MMKVFLWEPELAISVIAAWEMYGGSSNIINHWVVMFFDKGLNGERDLIKTKVR